MTEPAPGLTSPNPSNQKVCEACGQGFFCEAAAAGCWCEEIHLTASAREDISHLYNDCLCRNCLKRLACKVGD